MRTKTVHLSVLTVGASETHTMARRKILNITRQASQQINSKCATTRFFFNKDGLAVAHMSTSGIKCAHAVSAISTKFQLESLR